MKLSYTYSGAVYGVNPNRPGDLVYRLRETEADIIGMRQEILALAMNNSSKVPKDSGQPSYPDYCISRVNDLTQRYEELISFRTCLEQAIDSENRRNKSVYAPSWVDSVLRFVRWI